MNVHVAFFRPLVLFTVALVSPALFAQNSIQLFGPVNVRASATGTGYGAAAAVFNSNTLNLNCAASPITAILSSTPDSTGNILVDNNINVTVTAGSPSVGPTNVCIGGVNASTIGPFQNCFTSRFEDASSAPNFTGQDPDSFVSADGVSPIDISHLLVSGPATVKIDLQDEGFFLASSTLYLNTNCTQGGVTGPGLISGNPISSNPTPEQLSQDFSFNPLANQQIGFEYDLTAAQAAGDLSILNGTIPEVGDLPLDPLKFQPIYVRGTSFATSSCLVHSGELLNGQVACKLFTLQCKVGTGSNATGAQCPISVNPNEIFQDVFDGPAFALPDITTPAGVTFHQGIGFLMAKENWTGGSCAFDPAANLSNLLCPQNLLTSFTSSDVSVENVRKLQVARSTSAMVRPNVSVAASAPSSGTYTSSGRTTHPNSTFISIAQVPEDLTTVTLADQRPGNWIKTSTASVTLSSQPPNLTGTNLPGAANFVPSPIKSIIYGIAASDDVPVPGDTLTGDTTLANSMGCPTSANPSSPVASVYSPDQQVLTGLADGRYSLYYYAQDCAGTEELKFTKNGNGNWSTGFYTYPINVDTVAPVVASGPILSSTSAGPGTYTLGQAVTASYSCTDELSGVVSCGSRTFATGIGNTGTLTSPVDTSTLGTKTYTVTAVDAAGNQSSLSTKYNVVTTYDKQLQVSLSAPTVTFPGSTLVTVTILPSATNPTHAPTGTVQLILDGTTLITTLSPGGAGNGYAASHYNLSGVSAGQHGLTAIYSGDASNPGGTSAPTPLKVLPGPVTLAISCPKSILPYGLDDACDVFTHPIQAGSPGIATYRYDNGAPVSVSLSGGGGPFSIHRPPVGQHTIVVSYAAQGNFAVAVSQTNSFSVTAAPDTVSLTPSATKVTGGNLTLTAAVQSWSAGPPASAGAVTFMDGSKVLSTVPVDAGGSASLTLAASTLTNGSHTFTATYGGNTNYGTASAKVSVTVAHP